MDWILRNLPLFIILFVAIKIVRAVLQAKKQQESNQGTEDELEQQRRIREIQEQIRRKIAERRGEAVPPPLVVPRESPTPRVEPPPVVPPIDPFGGGGTLRRALGELERRLQPPEPPKIETRGAELRRQYELQDELRLAEDARQQTRRRTAHAAADRAETARSETALLSTARAQLLGDLGDPQSLRRAFVLREVLGPPVGLR